MSIQNDGFQTVISFETSSFSATLMDEMGVTPPSIEGGGAIDITSMNNTAWRTKVPKQLADIGELSLEIAYDPAFFATVATDSDALIQLNQKITVQFPDDSELEFWGWVDSFTPNENREGEQPTANITIIASNRNGSGAEQPPVYTA